MVPMEFGLSVFSGFFSVLFLVIKGGDMFTTGGAFQRSRGAALKIPLRCVKLCTKVITHLISGKEFCLACFCHAF